MGVSRSSSLAEWRQLLGVFVGQKQHQVVCGQVACSVTDRARLAGTHGGT